MHFADASRQPASTENVAFEILTLITWNYSYRGLRLERDRLFSSPSQIISLARLLLYGWYLSAGLRLLTQLNFAFLCPFKMSVNSVVYVQQILIFRASSALRESFTFFPPLVSCLILLLWSRPGCFGDDDGVKWCELKKSITSWVNNCRTLGDI